MTAPFTTIDDDSIASLVQRFYQAVRADPQLGPIFTHAIADAAWPAHLARMNAFWSSVMLGSGRYSGNPVGVHRAVPGLSPALFPRWLALFAATAQALFTADLAAAFTAKAGRIAASLQTAVFFRPGDHPATHSMTAPA